MDFYSPGQRAADQQVAQADRHQRPSTVGLVIGLHNDVRTWIRMERLAPC